MTSYSCAYDDWFFGLPFTPINSKSCISKYFVNGAFKFSNSFSELKSNGLEKQNNFFLCIGKYFYAMQMVYKLIYITHRYFPFQIDLSLI